MTACLAPLEEGEKAWHRWRLACDLDREPSATLELASLAVCRLGERAGDCAIAGRCRGLRRRGWLISQGCLEAAGQLALAAGRRGDRLLASGDLAMAWIGPRFEGHPFPLRKLRVGTMGVASQAQQGWDLAPLGALGREVRDAGLLALERDAAPAWIWSSASAGSGSSAGFSLPPLAVLIADQVRRNWRWSPPDGLRWILELVLAMRQHPCPDDLSAAIIAASLRFKALAELQAAVRVIDRLSVCSALQPLLDQLQGHPISLRDRLALQVRLSPPGSALHRAVAFRKKWGGTGSEKSQVRERWQRSQDMTGRSDRKDANPDGE